MEIAETTIFTREITRILCDEEYKELQSFLVEHPKSGVVIKGSGGLRKIAGRSKIAVKAVAFETSIIIMRKTVLSL
jgi:hypothetical protein